MNRTPTASYRFQLTPDFGFDAVVDRFETLVRLGVSHVYLSPIAEAVDGSQHGYDVVDHTSVRAEFGGADGLERLLDAAAERGRGVIIDHVPNHVSVARPELNAPWWQMLAEGPGSDAAEFFDIDWQFGGGKVIVAQLAQPIDEMIAGGDIEMRHDADGQRVVIGSLAYPLRAGTEGLELADALDRQHYRLQWWRNPERNVRRFFTIDELVAVRVEVPGVAAHVDTLVQRLGAHSAFAGVRVDHVDGLAEPGEYLSGLRELLGDRLLLVEKILAPGEMLPDSWPVDGTTGYEHITIAEHTLLDPAAREPLLRAWSGVADDTAFHDLERTARREVIENGLRPDIDRLVRVVADAEQTDIDASLTRRAVVLLTLELERYRTYLPDVESVPVFDELVDDVLERGAEADDAGELCTEIGRVARVLSGSDSRTRWQQLTGPVMAKGAEDRAFYRFFPLASLCEVGGSPGDFATSIDEFHRHQISRCERHPRAMLASTTHDTKRSAGVRTRSLALAARAEEWERRAAAWITARGDALGGTDRRFVSLALQTAITARPLSVDRLHDYLVKSAREGDEITSWTEQDDGVESALRRLAELAVESTQHGELAEFAQAIEPAGAAIGLRLLALQLTCPGFPDLYQGSPATLLSLVDPDNRVPPAWTQLDQLVDDVTTTDTETAFVDGSFDLARTTLTERILRLRQRRPTSFDDRSGYRPLPVTGPDADHIIAFARTDPASLPVSDTGRDTDGGVEDGVNDATVVVIVARARAAPIEGSQTRVELPEGTWRSILLDDARIADHGPTRLADLMSSAEVVVLDRTDD